MMGVGIGEAVVIGAICCILGGGLAAIVGVVFFVTRKNKDS